MTVFRPRCQSLERHLSAGQGLLPTEDCDRAPRMGISCGKAVGGHSHHGVRIAILYHIRQTLVSIRVSVRGGVFGLAETHDFSDRRGELADSQQLDEVL